MTDNGRTDAQDYDSIYCSCIINIAFHYVRDYVRAY